MVDTVGFNSRGWTGAYPRTELLRMEERYRRVDLRSLGSTCHLRGPWRLHGAVDLEYDLGSRATGGADRVCLRKQQMGTGSGRVTIGDREMGVLLMKPNAIVLLTILGLLVTAVPINAHHSFASVFDRDAPINLTGTVTKVEWMNPHTWFYVDVENEDGDIENWALEMGSPNTLLRRGWNRGSLQVGQLITVVGFRARERELTGAVASVTLSTGEKLFGAQDQSR